MKSFVIWGTGRRASRFLANGYFSKCRIVGFIDTYKSEDYFMGIPIYLPEALDELMKGTDYLLISTWNIREIYEKCIELRIDLRKIIFVGEVKVPAIRKTMNIIKENLPELYSEMQKRPFSLVALNEKDSFDSSRLLGTLEFSDEEYYYDYFRYRTFEFIAEELLAAEIKGAVAELGVFRGKFSRMINRKFSGKKMYLFDTFEGFDLEEAEKELSLGRCNESFIESHRDTSVDILLSNLLFPEQCVICKGIFPQSVTEEAREESYCFVSLDVDFEDSMYAGIDFFYPRLVDGGILYIHDYNTYFLDGIKIAIKRYEEDQGIRLKKIPIADRAGTLIVIK